MGRNFRTPKQFLQILNRIADRRIGEIEAGFLAAVNVTVSTINFPKLVDALQRRDVTAVLDAAQLNGLQPRLRRSLESSLRKVFNTAAIATQATLPPDLQFKFNLVDPRAVRWARLHTAKLVTQISDHAKANIRKLIARNIREGISIAGGRVDTARVLRRDLKATLGLTQASYDGLQVYRDTLNKRLAVSKLLRAGIDRDAIAEQARVTPQYVGRLANRRWLWLESADVEARVDREAGRRLRYRAKVIGRTETLTAANAGNYEAWQQAADLDYIRPAQTRRIFVVAKDDRTCPICKAIPTLNPNGVRFDEPFRTPVGLKMLPPIHVQCRCSTALKFELAEQAQEGRQAA